jgi:hypothetical protein
MPKSFVSARTCTWKDVTLPPLRPCKTAKNHKETCLTWINQSPGKYEALNKAIVWHLLWYLTCILNHVFQHPVTITGKLLKQQQRSAISRFSRTSSTLGRQLPDLSEMLSRTRNIYTNKHENLLRKVSEIYLHAATSSWPNSFKQGHQAHSKSVCCSPLILCLRYTVCNKQLCRWGVIPKK